MDIIDRTRKLEARIARIVEGAAERVMKPRAREPLAVMHLVVQAAEHEVQAAGRDAHVFPFNRIRVSVLAPSREARARFEALFDGSPSLRERIVERLASAGCDVSDLAVKIAYLPAAQADWMAAECHVQFERVHATVPIPPPRPALARIRLLVLAGAAAQLQYSFAQARIDLGRCTEVRDRRHRLLRTNDVVFTDCETPPNPSVSRRHAHIRSATDGRHYRLYDDRSEHGTGVIRGGATIVVPAGSRGVRLLSGDEIVLGEARLRVTVGDA